MQSNVICWFPVCYLGPLADEFFRFNFSSDLIAFFAFLSLAFCLDVVDAIKTRIFGRIKCLIAWNIYENALLFYIYWNCSETSYSFDIRFLSSSTHYLSFFCLMDTWWSYILSSSLICEYMKWCLIRLGTHLAVFAHIMGRKRPCFMVWNINFHKLCL